MKPAAVADLIVRRANAGAGRDGPLEADAFHAQDTTSSSRMMTASALTDAVQMARSAAVAA